MAVPSDTADVMARIQNGLLRQAGLARRAKVARSLSATVIDLSRRALRERMPTATERELLLRWVSLEYGADLARRVAAYTEPARAGVGRDAEKSPRDGQ